MKTWQDENSRTWHGDSLDVVLEYAETISVNAYGAEAIEEAIQLRLQGWKVIDEDGLWFRRSRFETDDPRQRAVHLRRFKLVWKAKP